MPYVLPYRRPLMEDTVVKFLDDFEDLHGAPPTAGDLNFFVSYLIHVWTNKQGVNYENLSQGRAILQDAADEFYRTIIAPYEDAKEHKNGMVSSLRAKVLRKPT